MAGRCYIGAGQGDEPEKTYPSGFQRHKIVTDVEARKHFDPKLFARLADLLPPQQ